VCLIADYANCDAIPYKSFKLVWQDGDTLEELQVPNKCNIAMTNDDMRKYRYAHDKAPFNPVGYAPRGMNPQKMFLAVKE